MPAYNQLFLASDEVGIATPSTRPPQPRARPTRPTATRLPPVAVRVTTTLTTTTLRGELTILHGIEHGTISILLGLICTLLGLICTLFTLLRVIGMREPHRSATPAERRPSERPASSRLICISRCGGTRCPSTCQSRDMRGWPGTGELGNGWTALALRKGLRFCHMLV